MKKKKSGPSETEIQNSILSYIERRSDVWAWRNNNTPTYDPIRKCFRKMPKWTPKGVPDIIGIHKSGRIILLEVKTPTGKVSKDQKAFLDRARALGAITAVVRSPEDTEIVLDAAGIELPDEQNCL